MSAEPIRTEAEYESALAEVRRLWDSPIGTEDGDRLNLLVDLVVAYEDEHCGWAAINSRLNEQDNQITPDAQ